MFSQTTLYYRRKHFSEQYVVSTTWFDAYEDTTVKKCFQKYKFAPLIKMGRINSKSDFLGEL